MFGILDKFKPRPATTEELIQAWLDSPLECIKGQFDAEVKWDTCYGLAPMGGLPDSHGYSQLPDLKIVTTVRKTERTIGWIEGISMHSGGVARVRHFALDAGLSGHGYGSALLKSIIGLLKTNHAIKIEFRETHTSKLDHYRKLFAKNGIEEVSRGVWCINLYEDGKVPKETHDFQVSLMKYQR